MPVHYDTQFDQADVVKFQDTPSTIACKCR